MSFNKISIGLLLGLCFISLVYNVEILDPTSAPVLGEVVKNITKVNSLLQDLIKNYEKLKKMSQPESLESNYDDAEIHELFNDNNKTKRKKRSKATTATARTLKIYATAIDISDDEKDNKNDENSLEVRVSTASTKPNKKERKRKKKNKAKQNLSHKVGIKKVGGNSGEESSLEKENHLEQKSQQSKVLKGLPAQLKKIAKKLFSDHLDKSEEATTRSNATYKQTYTDTMTNFPVIVRPRTTEVTKEKKKYLEPRISRDGIDLDVQSNVQKVRIDPSSNVEDSKTSTQVTTLKKKLEPAIELSDFNSDTVEESKVILNEEIKTDVLRQAYGDACLKLVVRKCYMACKATFKDVCRTHHKCTTVFKTSFKKHAIYGCDSYFHNNSISFRSRNGDENNKEFADITRDGYLSMACGPGSFRKVVNDTTVLRRVNEQARLLQIIINDFTQSPTSYRKQDPLKINKNITSTEIKRAKPILRDKYEIACQQASRMKCYKGCKYGATEACKEERCGSKKKTALDKACKSRCKQSYGGKDSDDDSGSDDSESSSEKEEKEEIDEWRR